MQALSVNAVIFSKDQKQILIIKRRDVPVWVLPGGGVDPNESPEDAIIREVKEETGCVVAITRKSGVYFPVNRLAITTHVFVCEVASGTPQIGDETREIGYYPLDALPPTFFHVHNDFVQDVMKNSAALIIKPLIQVTYFELFKYFLKHPVRVFRFFLSKSGFPINS